MEVSESKLIIAVVMVFLLGVFFSLINGYYTKTYGTPLPIIVYALAVVSLGVGAFLVTLFQWKINQRQLERILKILPEDERKVMEILVKEKRIEQAYLVAETGLSKVKISRITSKLQGRGIVKKKKFGNTNLVTLDI